MATEAQLIARVLGMLRAVGSGQTPNAEDSTLVESYIPEKLSDLAARNVIYIADAASLPDGSLQWVAMAIAQDLADDFGAAPDAGKIALAEARLRELQTQGSYAVQQAEYY